MTPSAEQLQTLLELVLATEPDELDCDEMLHRVAALLEARGEGADLTPELAAVSQHLSLCPECREEFDALLRATDEGPQGDPPIEGQRRPQAGSYVSEATVLRDRPIELGGRWLGREH